MARLKNPIDKPSPLTRAQRTVLADLWEREQYEELLRFLDTLPGSVGTMLTYAIWLGDRERCERYVRVLLREER